MSNSLLKQQKLPFITSFADVNAALLQQSDNDVMQNLRISDLEQLNSVVDACYGRPME